MKRIIIWGFGRCGKFMIDNMDVLRSRQFEIIGVADTYAEEMNQKLEGCSNQGKYHRIYKFEEVKQLYDDKMIDGVFIAIRNKADYRKVEECLSVVGIPIFRFIDSKVVFAELYAKDRIQISEEMQINILNHVVVQSCCGIADSCYFAYIFSEDGNVFWESDRILSNTYWAEHTYSNYYQKNMRKPQLIRHSIC